MQPKHSEEELLKKIKGLPPDKVAQVEDFIDFLNQGDEDRSVTQSATELSEAAFQSAWDNPDDAEYDRL